MRTGRADLDAMLKVASIPADEPAFVLRGQDVHAAAAVRFWAQSVIAGGGSVALAELALQQADAMTSWAVKKAPDLDLPDAERLQLEYAHGRRGQVRSGALEVSYAYEQGAAAGVAKERRGRRASDLREAALVAALQGAVESIEGDRDVLIECCTLGGDLTTLDPVAAPHLERYDQLLAAARAAVTPKAGEVSDAS